MNTADKLAEALRRCEQVIREACEEDPGKWDWAAINADEGAQAREALAAHEQAQADDWQHLKPYGYAPGNYMSRCRTCGDTPVMDKRAITCRPCAEAKFAASQAQAERVGLTDEQIRREKPVCADWASFRAGVRCAERIHGVGK